MKNCKNLLKKITASMLVMSMISSLLAFAAVEETETQDASASSYSLPVQDEYVIEPTETVEEFVPVNPDYITYENEEDYKITLNEPNPKARTSTSEITKWTNVFKQQFGDSFMQNHELTTGTRIKGQTNKLVIEEVDVALEGRNGLDLILKRSYDNQDTNDVTFGYATATTYQNTEKWYVYRYVYPDGKSINIGFLSPEECMRWMPDEIKIDELPETLYEGSIAYTDGEKVKFYTDKKCE